MIELGTSKIKLITLDEPNSIHNEIYRSIQTNIEYSSVDKQIKIINITSSVADESKTTTVCNLAIIAANNNKRILLVDLDLRKPSIHRAFKTKNKNGVTDMLIDFSNNGEKIDIYKYCEQVKHDNLTGELFILPAGTETPNPYSILKSKALKDMLTFLSDKFDQIYLDCSPSGILADGVVSSTLADGTIFVVESNHTKIDMIQKTLSQLRNVNVNILGVVLTKVPNALKSYGYYYGHYYTSKENYNSQSKKIDEQ